MVTGGAGFIGSNFVRLALQKSAAQVVVIDKLTYAGNLANLQDVASNPKFKFERADIARDDMKALFEKYNADTVINFAAETHVDRSIDGPAAFVETNVVGTFNLLEAFRQHWIENKSPADFRFLHVSTDEVYGSLGATGLFSESTPYNPNSPYSATKAGADHLVRAYHETYELPALITNCSNNYGPYQFPEKLIPLMILNALEGKSLPIYGDGGNIRDWIYVEDHCEGVLTALLHGNPGEKYNIGAGEEKTNVSIVDTICDILEDLAPAAYNAELKSKGVMRYKDLKKFVQDRPGHDRRYAIDSSKMMRELAWKPAHSFEQGLRATVKWYIDHRSWCQEIQSGNYQRERLGLKT